MVTGADPDLRAASRARALGAADLRRDRAADPGLAEGALRGRGSWPRSLPATATRPRTAPRSSSRRLRAASGGWWTSSRPAGPRPSSTTPRPTTCSSSRRFENGDVEATLAGAAVVVERAFRTNRQTAAPLEGRGGVAAWNPAEGKLTLWSGTQVPHLARHGLAGILGLAENRVRDRGARRGRRVRGEGDPLSRGRRALPARDASRPSRQMGRAASGEFSCFRARARPSLCGAGRLRRGRPTARHGRSRHLQCRRLLRLSVDRRPRSAHGGRAFDRALQARALPLRGGGRGDEHHAGGPVSRGSPSRHHVRDGARARSRRPRSGPRSRRDQAHQPHRARRSAVHLCHAARSRQPELSRVLREDGGGDRVRNVPRRAGAPQATRTLRRHRVRRLQRADRARPGRLGRSAHAIPHRP